jgi:hypothetical protein
MRRRDGSKLLKKANPYTQIDFFSAFGRFSVVYFHEGVLVRTVPMSQ